MIRWVADLAILKVGDSRPEDARDVLLNFSRVDVPEDLRQGLLEAYEPQFRQHFKHIAPGYRATIKDMYKTN
jgi:hypothetical protein